MTKLAVLTSSHTGVLKEEFLGIESGEEKLPRPKKITKKSRHTTGAVSSTHQSNSNKEKSLLKKDVFWQISEPVDTQENMDYFLSSLMVNEEFSFSDDFLNELDLTPTIVPTTTRQNLTVQQQSLNQAFPIVDNCENHRQRQSFDSVSSTSDDSLGSMESVEEPYNMVKVPNFNQNQYHKESHTLKLPSYDYCATAQKEQYCQMNTKPTLHNIESKTINRGGSAKRPSNSRRQSGATSKRKIDSVYNNDPYLQRHRLLVNARQKNRMMKINNMYTMLNSLIPEQVLCEANVKPHSKLGILKRAIVYWSSLADTLNTPAPTPVDADSMLMENDQTSSLLNTVPIKKEEQPEQSNYCLMSTLNNLSN
uniref:BHLH domain-containing protein n=1 Tax=Clytia hemisphaerica TaxID=252671 RepID=A0A7M5UGB5_9CNID|eukprot:TCONS_00005526-protein